MKSLKEYSMNLSENDYHAYPAWSHSLVATYAREGFSSLEHLHEKKESTPSMEFGSLFDSILTRGKETLNEYQVVNMSVPESEKKVLEALYTTTSLPFDQIPMETFSTVTDMAQYRKNWGVKARYDNLAKYKDYYDIISSGKKLVSKKDWDDAVEMAKAFRENKLLKDLFGTKNTKDIEYIYQLQLLHPVELENGDTVDFKIMLDLTVVNHKEKTIQPVDLKTSSVPGWSFKENFLKFRYDLQAQPYVEILQAVINEIPEYKDYTILPFIFSDISRTDKIPVSFFYDPREESQKDGLAFGNYKYKNWKTLLSEIITYEKEQAKVPSYIKTDELNDLLAILNA